MIKMYIRSYFPSRFFLLAAIVGGMICLAETSAIGQSSSAAPGDPISKVDLPEGQWKDVPAYTAILASERANNVVVLANPTIKETNLALYNGYDRMLSYMQSDLSGGVPIQDIAAKNYSKVVTETPGDPNLVNMQANEFLALYNALVVMLRQ